MSLPGTPLPSEIVAEKCPSCGAPVSSSSWEGNAETPGICPYCGSVLLRKSATAGSSVASSASASSPLDDIYPDDMSWVPPHAVYARARPSSMMAVRGVAIVIILVIVLVAFSSLQGLVPSSSPSPSPPMNVPKDLGVTVETSPSSGAAPLTVTVWVEVVGGTAPYTTIWNFGDNTITTITSENCETTHTYSTVGTYTITATVSDSSNLGGTGAAVVSTS